MHLKHYSTIKNTNGVFDVTVAIVDVINCKEVMSKPYTYNLSSEYAVRKFTTLYRKSKKTHGRAIAVLNKFKITD